MINLFYQNLPAVGSAFNLILIRTSQRRVETVKEIDQEKDILSTVLQFRDPVTFHSTLENTECGSSSLSSVNVDPFAGTKMY